MRTVVRRRTFLAGVGILFLLSFALPAIGDWGHFFRSVRGLDAFCAALSALSHPLKGPAHLRLESARAVLMALSVVANLFFVVGWAFAAAGLRPSGRGNAAAWMARGLFSLVLALLPLLWWGVRAC